MNFDCYPTVAGIDRLTARFYGDRASVDTARAAMGRRLFAEEALKLGLVTATPDALDWDEELRISIEERAQSLAGRAHWSRGYPALRRCETMDTRIFGRLSAWQNWIFSRPNAVGETGAIKVFGTGSEAKFDWERV